MPSSRHHNEWLSLIEVSGPFLSIPVLDRVFPHGLDKDDTPEGKELVRNLRLAFDEWEDDKDGERPNPAIHKAWIDFVIKQGLGQPDEVLAEGQNIPQTLKATIAEHGETLRPDLVVRNPEGGVNAGKVRLLVKTYPPTQGLEKPIAGRHWKASPATRMMELLHATGTRLGLVTNGEQWMLVDAPKGETTGFASWYATLWFEEPLTLRAFRSLLGVHRFFSVDEDDTLEKILKESASNQQDVTIRLGYQVREAVEETIRCLDRIDQDEGRQLLEGVTEGELYEAALTVMMRLVFLFYAEENKLIPSQADDPIYLTHYAVTTIIDDLQETADQQGEEVLERRHDAWVRLLSTFRAVYGGIQHERLKLLPYAGKLFNPDRFLFLDGRKKWLDEKGKQINDWTREEARPLAIDNRTVLHLLRSLQYLEMHGEARRLSFQALDIEQIGHVYEGLLDHTAKRATGTTLSLIAAKGDEPEVALSELERLRTKGEAELLKFLSDKDVTGRSESALKKSLDNPVEGDVTKKIRAACGDEATYNRLRPFSALIRTDTFDRPVVIRKGSVFVTAGTDRRSSGTHYTQKSLTEPIVKYTLEPLVYIGPAEGKPKEEWKLQPAKELLDLKVCDEACGSGAFLVQACRYLSELLVESWEDAEKRHPGVPGITPEGTASTGAAKELLIPKDTNERLALARRIVAQRCLYGVDKNPLAVEMAKLSLWLLTLAKDKPFTFLDHAIRCGDSLVGIRDIRQVQYFQLDLDQADRSLFAGPVMSLVDEAVALRKKIEALPASTVEDVRDKERLLAEAEGKTARLRLAADLLISVEFQLVLSAGEKEALHNSMAIQAGHYVQNGSLEDFRAAAKKVINGLPTFHWPLEFPEVMLDRGGFDAFVCNPPFMGGKKITRNLGTLYRDHLVDHLAGGQKGHADLCAYFFLRAASLLREGGQFGFLATNTIAQGDTREVGLDQLTAKGCVIPRAVPSRPWPGTASLEVAHVWLRRGQWNKPFVLDEKPVSGITSFLTEPNAVVGTPHRLAANAGKSFQGSNVLGLGFILEPEEAQRLIEKDPRNRDVLFPYLNGEDLNSRPDQSPSRWVINFFDWPIEKAMQYPDCFRIVEEKVKPERTRKKTSGDFALRKPLPQKWWIYADKRPELYRTIARMERVLVRARIANIHSMVWVPAGWVYNEKTVVFVDCPLSVMQSNVHEAWARNYSSTLRTDMQYTPSDCFETFPFPHLDDRLDSIEQTYLDHRRRVMLSRQEGLTKTYNRFHDPDESASDIQKLRDLHVGIDEAVAAAYGWTDLNLGHGFHETKQGIRFTISESARREVLARLLKLNHEL